MPKRRRKRKKSVRKAKPSKFALWLRRLFLRGIIVGIVAATLYTFYLDFRIQHQFEGKRWSVAARVYARPLELYAGRQLSLGNLRRELKALGYRNDSGWSNPGTYWQTGSTLHIASRPFIYWDGEQKAQQLSLGFSNDQLISLRNRRGKNVDLARLEPIKIGGIYPAHNEDRLLIKLEQAPKKFIDALLAVEDRNFYQHHGIVPSAIGRAMWQNLQAGRTVQGGSTITQQLVKNFFLTQKRSLWRKANEAVMALLMEWHYDKDEILQAYLNEVYLGQNGKRGVHGFGLASRFYFGQDLQDLNTAQTALLVATIKGPSYYNPRRHPKRALKRRNLVLDVMQQQGLINNKQSTSAKRSKLSLVPKPRASATDYPAYLDLVRRQLRRDYRDEDLRSEGLQIFTSFDPHVQWQAERALSLRIKSLEKQRKLSKNSLQGAVVVTSTDNGELLAVVGDRSPRASGFNRALDAVRPIGSLMKPAVYLNALERSSEYSLASLLDDTPLTIDRGNKELWRPANYDKRFHGQVLLRDALVHSYNVSTVRLGQQLGMNSIAKTLKQLGVQREVHRFPSLSLGTAPLSPIEVTQMYQTFAASGFRSPLRAIREVLDGEGKPLQRYPLTVEQAFDPNVIYLLNTALSGVVEEGTARSLENLLPEGLRVAGKTGTTDDLRDSWFAGFTANHLAVVWLGADDNRNAGLTGASGAMRVWADVMTKLDTQSLDLTATNSIEQVWIERQSGLRGNDDCEDVLVLPFITGTAPKENAACAGGIISDTLNDLFNFLGDK